MRYDSAAYQSEGSYPQYRAAVAEPVHRNPPPPPIPSENMPLNSAQVSMVQVSETIFLTESPVYTRCDTCRQYQYTKPQFEPGMFTYMNCCCLTLVLMCCVPFFINRCKDCVHHCGNCGAYLGRKPACT